MEHQQMTLLTKILFDEPLTVRFHCLTVLITLTAEINPTICILITFVHLHKTSITVDFLAVDPQPHFMF